MKDRGPKGEMTDAGFENARTRRDVDRGGAIGHVHPTMAEPPPANHRWRRLAWWYALPALVAFAYAGGHFLWYRDTPLGHGPVVDEQENLALAEGIVRGELPREPFYRAAGYPLALAGLRTLGVTTGGLFSAALALGVLLHALNAALVAGVAGRWFGGAGALAAGLLFALHPVFVHYSTQALDAVPALSLFLVGLWALAGVIDRAPGDAAAAWRWAVASGAWAAATLCRPNYLVAWSLVAAWTTWLAFRQRAWRLGVAAGAGVVLLGVYAGWQWRVSGVAGFLPWQGAYNLWAANAPGAHGRYYVQHTAIPAALAHQNPARLESVFLYREANGRAPADYRDLNAYWRQRFLERIARQPFAWLGQLARKAYALLNHWEQYNNKTYAFHQARSPWLRHNPIGWGLVALLGVAGLARLATREPRAARALMILGATLALSILLFFVSARFRLPLAALLVILAGGAWVAPTFWRHWPRPRRLVLGAALCATGGIAFSRFDDVAGRATFVMDHALIARAAFTIGDARTAWAEANHALALQPTHRDALRVAISAHFNRLIGREEASAEESRWRELCGRLLSSGRAPETRELRALAALALWRAGRQQEALATWHELGGTASAVAARLLAGDRTVTRADLARAPAALWREPLVRLAATTLRIPPPPGVTLQGDVERAQAALDILFGRRAP